MPSSIRIGTRGSALALWQANHVVESLRRSTTDISVELLEIQTSGDVIQDIPLSQIGGQGAFTKEIQRAVQERRIDVAVHSLKDLPTFPVENLTLASVPPRGPAGDAFISKKHGSFAELPEGAAIATSSLRRRAQLLHRRPDLKLVEIRGNVDTRLQKLAKQDLDGLILAEAGLIRLGRHEDITEVLDPAWMLPAIGQGAIGLECRADDIATIAMLDRINDPPTYQCVLAERALLRGLGGGCQVPIAAISSIVDGQLMLRGAVLQPDGGRRIEDTITGPSTDSEQLGVQLAERMLSAGAEKLLTKA